MRTARRKVTARPAADTEGVKDGAGDVEVPHLRGGSWTEHGVLPELWHEVLAANACCASGPSAAWVSAAAVPKLSAAIRAVSAAAAVRPFAGRLDHAGVRLGLRLLARDRRHLPHPRDDGAPLAGASTYAPSKQNVAGSRPVSRSTPYCICVGIRRCSGNGASPNLAHPGLASCAGKRQDQAAGGRLRFGARSAVTAVRASPASRTASAPSNRTGNHGPGSFGQANGPP